MASIPFDWTSEVISNDQIRQMQIELADQVFKVLYEPIKKRDTLLREEIGYSGLSSNFLSPSMIAALTVLYMDKHQNTACRNLVV